MEGLPPLSGSSSLITCTCAHAWDAMHTRHEIAISIRGVRVYEGGCEEGLGAEWGSKTSNGANVVSVGE
jgi:hypothetical protein